MTRKKTHRQIRAKKNWLLHKPSVRRSVKRRSGIFNRLRSTTFYHDHQYVDDGDRAPSGTCACRATDILEIVTGSQNETTARTDCKDSTLATEWRFRGMKNLVPKIPSANTACCAVMNGVLCTYKGMGSLVELFKGGVFNGIQGIGKKLSQSGDVLFPATSYKRKLEEVSGRLDELEREFKRLKSLHTDQLVCRVCQNELHPQTAPHGACSINQATSIPNPPHPPAPPPPPPPPPPVAKLEHKKKFASSSNINKNSKANHRPICLEDIRSVRLKRVNRQPSENVSPNGQDSGSGKRPSVLMRSPLRDITQTCTVKKSVKKTTAMQPVITMRDLLRVKLRTNSSGCGSTGYKFKTPESSIVILRRNLRKVDVRRSPGGTPIVDNKEETGTGLTPMMTRALRRKFKLANPPSASPDSPTSRGRKRYSLSSPEISSFSPTSPLALN